METLRGSIEDIVYYNNENGYSVVKLNVNGVDLTVVGSFPELTPGEELEVSGERMQHKVYGEQFKAVSYQRILPVGTKAIERYLESGIIKGIGSHYAGVIVKQFGKKTLDVLDQEPERLLDIPGIGPSKLTLIVNSWKEQKNVYEVMSFLQSIDLTVNMALKICREYGADAIKVVKEDPYRLAQDIRGIGFQTADRIASQQNLPKDHPGRIAAGLVYLLRQQISDGHVYMLRPMLEAQAVQLLGIPKPAISQILDEKATTSQYYAPSAWVIDQEFENEQRVYLQPYYLCEMGVAERIAWLLEQGERHSRIRASTLLTPSMIANEDITSEQSRAVEMALKSPLSVMTGGPGTGKSYTVSTLIAVLESLHKEYALAAPTGRAAKRLSEATRRKATTIHRLLAFKPNSDDEEDEFFSMVEPEELKLDCLVVDEASMLDLPLAYRLLQSIPRGCHLLLVGDVDQLPSVGAGNFLSDVIASEQVPVTRLTQIFRQAATSRIIANAHHINRGEMPALDNQRDGDFFLFNFEKSAEAAAMVESLVTERIRKNFGFGAEQIQVLSPMHKGEAGVKSLNSLLQNALNPPSPLKVEKSIAGTLFRQGDRVMQIKNEYEKEVFNGDVGRLVEINTDEHTLMVEIDGRGVVYEFNEADQLVLAYASTIHKSQGSEYPCVVMVLLNEHHVMLARNLLYTGITRAQKLCVLVSNRKAINLCVNNNRVMQRNSALAIRIRTSIAKQPK